MDFCRIKDVQTNGSKAEFENSNLCWLVCKLYSLYERRDLYG